MGESATTCFPTLYPGEDAFSGRATASTTVDACCLHAAAAEEKGAYGTYDVLSL